MRYRGWHHNRRHRGRHHQRSTTWGRRQQHRVEHIARVVLHDLTKHSHGGHAGSSQRGPRQDRASAPHAHRRGHFHPKAVWQAQKQAKKQARRQTQGVHARVPYRPPQHPPQPPGIANSGVPQPYPQVPQQPQGLQSPPQVIEHPWHQIDGQINIQHQQPSSVAVQDPQSRVSVQEPASQVSVQEPAPRISVQQPPPRIEVQQQQPRVIVHQQQPEVVVHQQQPEVVVHQQQPEVMVHQQQPEVVVHQQQPEVMVHQQQPEVMVHQQQPEVMVHQQQPEVMVHQQQQQQAQHKVIAAMSIQQQPILFQRPKRQGVEQIRLEKQHTMLQAQQPQVLQSVQPVMQQISKQRAQVEADRTIHVTVNNNQPEVWPTLPAVTTTTETTTTTTTGPAMRGKGRGKKTLHLLKASADITGCNSEKEASLMQVSASEQEADQLSHININNGGAIEFILDCSGATSSSGLSRLPFQRTSLVRKPAFMSGQSSVVYAVNNQWLVKLARSPNSEQTFEPEFNAAHEMQKLGLSVPETYLCNAYDANGQNGMKAVVKTFLAEGFDLSQIMLALSSQIPDTHEAPLSPNVALAPPVHQQCSPITAAGEPLSLSRCMYYTINAFVNRGVMKDGFNIEWVKQVRQELECLLSTMATDAMRSFQNGKFRMFYDVTPNNLRWAKAPGSEHYHLYVIDTLPVMELNVGQGPHTMDEVNQLWQKLLPSTWAQQGVGGTCELSGARSQCQGDSWQCFNIPMTVQGALNNFASSCRA